MASSAQVGKIVALMREAGIRREEAIDMAGDVAGRSVTDFSDLSQTEASDLIERMEDDFGS